MRDNPSNAFAIAAFDAAYALPVGGAKIAFIELVTTNVVPSPFHEILSKVVSRVPKRILEK